MENTTAREIFTISQLNRRARQLLETHFSLIWVRGEISNLARPGSGHWYFTLKDKDAQIRCAMFRNRNNLVSKPPREGDQVLVRGRISLYENRGDYQLIAEHLEADGIGKLQQQFDELKNRLAQEGLFDPADKQTLPQYPKQIGVITSPTGAALRDILHVLERRSPWIPVTLYPTPVQGRQAATEIAAAIHYANQEKRCDVLIVGRGGGSLEDLWPFNEEVVARAIHASEIPIVSAVGHETDFSIADFVADLRAPTPSAAAEIVSPDKNTLLEMLSGYSETLHKHLQRRIEQELRRIDGLRKRLRNPVDQLRQQAQHLDHLDIRLHKGIHAQVAESRGRFISLQRGFQAFNPAKHCADAEKNLLSLQDRLIFAVERKIQHHKERLAGLVGTMQAVSPLATLERGYAIATDPSGKVIRSIAGPETGSAIEVRLRDGKLSCTIDSKTGIEDQKL